MFGNLLGDTGIVGFATTTKSNVANVIMSVQPIYYSNDLKICSCLNGHPTMSRDTKKHEEPPSDEAYLDRLAREGTLDGFVNFIVSLIGLMVGIAILVGILCYFSRAKTPKI